MRGEGHFIAKLRKKRKKSQTLEFKKQKAEKAKELQLFYDFADKYLNLDLDNLNIEVHNDFVYHVPEGLPDLSNIKVYRYGWQLGELKKTGLSLLTGWQWELKLYKLKDFWNLKENKRKIFKRRNF
ncbi:NOL1/NOP2/sun family RNA methylase [Thermoanaerobacter ethanolicus JW 200]|nr:NOL1/NOP2/sun family RNA methylase [Thermoanaerobacter ethanolicus JW 200]